jgi:hypothetical protein
MRLLDEDEVDADSGSSGTKGTPSAVLVFPAHLRRNFRFGPPTRALYTRSALLHNEIRRSNKNIHPRLNDLAAIAEKCH